MAKSKKAQGYVDILVAFGLIFLLVVGAGLFWLVVGGVGEKITADAAASTDNSADDLLADTYNDATKGWPNVIDDLIVLFAVALLIFGFLSGFLYDNLAIFFWVGLFGAVVAIMGALLMNNVFYYLFTDTILSSYYAYFPLSMILIDNFVFYGIIYIVLSVVGIYAKKTN